MLFNVSIIETLKMNIIIKAKSREEAEQFVSDRWHNSEYILDSGNFVDVNFTAEEVDNEG